METRMLRRPNGVTRIDKEMSKQEVGIGVALLDDNV